MKKNALVMLLFILGIYASAFSQKFPEFKKGKDLKEGDVIIKETLYKNQNDKNYPKKIKAEYITLAVRENRNNSNSRIITIPILKIHSLSTTPKEPVFLLNGGPGASNLYNFALFLVDQHDVVMVGYRGADGSSILNFKNFAESLVVDSGSFSDEHLKNIAQVMKKDLDRLTSEGIDLNCYNIIDVIDDIEIAKNKLGYNTINLMSYSYGTRLAYIYGRRYPQSINRSLCALVNPPGHMSYDSDIQDNVLKQYGNIWKNDTSNLKRSADIINTIQSVMSSLPKKWKKINVDPGKVRFMMHNLLYTTNGAALMFDAFIAAENGDYSGLACIVMMYDRVPKMKVDWGDLILKGATADYIPGKNYTTETDSKENLIGAIHSKLFALIDLSGFQFKLIPENYRKLDTSYVNTVLINGNLDISTPLSNSKELIPYLPNGKLIELSDCSHQDLVSKQTEAFNSFVKEYFLTGQIKDQDFKHIPADLSAPKTSLQKIGKILYKLKRVGLF